MFFCDAQDRSSERGATRNPFLVCVCVCVWGGGGGGQGGIPENRLQDKGGSDLYVPALFRVAHGCSIKDTESKYINNAISYIQRSS